MGRSESFGLICSLPFSLIQKAEHQLFITCFDQRTDHHQLTLHSTDLLDLISSLLDSPCYAMCGGHIIYLLNVSPTSKNLSCSHSGRLCMKSFTFSVRINKGESKLSSCTHSKRSNGELPEVVVRYILQYLSSKWFILRYIL